MVQKEFLSDVLIDIHVRHPEVSTDDKTDTKLQISELRDKRWTRGEIQRLYRQITSISSPFGQVGRDDFEAILRVPDVPQWIERLPDPLEFLKRAPWKYTLAFDGENFSYHYNFRGIPGIQRKAREVEEKQVSLLVPPPEVDGDGPLISGKSQPTSMRKVIADLKSIEGIGPVSGEFYVFDLTQRIAKKICETKLIKNFLDENGGIRVYRDGMRVYDYGEQSNDWLGLDLNRVNNPTRGLSRNIVVGHVSIDQDGSPELVEKFNREGFIENDAYERFKQIVLDAIDPLQREREVDRKAIRELLAQVGTCSAKIKIYQLLMFIIFLLCL